MAKAYKARLEALGWRLERSEPGEGLRSGWVGKHKTGFYISSLFTSRNEAWQVLGEMMEAGVL